MRDVQPEDIPVVERVLEDLAVQFPAKAIAARLTATEHSASARRASDIVEYEQILSIVSAMGELIGRHPRDFQNMEEEVLRSHILVQLSGQYKGRATGETVNGNGKTDILVRSTEGRNIFVAECKFWDGPASFSDALSQLLGYATWGDDKLALLILNKNKNLTAVLGQIPNLLSAHPNFLRDQEYTSSIGIPGFRCFVHHDGDKQQELMLTVLVFDLVVSGNRS